MQQKYVF
jgi:hypothetical protein